MKTIILAMALLIALYTVATAKEVCRVVSEPNGKTCAVIPSKHYSCDGERCIELVALPEYCLRDRIVCGDESAFKCGGIPR